MLSSRVGSHHSQTVTINPQQPLTRNSIRFPRDIFSEASAMVDDLLKSDLMTDDDREHIKEWLESFKALTDPNERILAFLHLLTNAVYEKFSENFLSPDQMDILTEYQKTILNLINKIDPTFIEDEALEELNILYQHILNERAIENDTDSALQTIRIISEEIGSHLYNLFQNIQQRASDTHQNNINSARDLTNAYTEINRTLNIRRQEIEQRFQRSISLESTIREQDERFKEAAYEANETLRSRVPAIPSLPLDWKGD